MKYLSIICCFFFFFCTEQNNRKYKVLTHGNVTNEGVVQNSSGKVKGCIDARDTILFNGNYIKYQDLDTFYDVRVGIMGIDTLMGFKFDCSTPYVLVPKYFFSSKNKFYLNCGYGQHFREIIVCELKNNKIFVSRFESECSGDAKYDYAYKDGYDNRKLILQNHLTNRKKVITIPEKNAGSVVIRTEIHRTGVIIHLEKDKSVSIAF